jgi:hypothetical protein
MSSEYFAKWYAENKEKLAAKRRERYLNDPTYREKVLSNSKKSRKLVSSEVEKGSGRIVGADGVERNIYSVSETAFLLNVSRETLVLWERAGLLPADPFSGTKSRHFTAGQIDGIKKAIEAHRNGAKRVHIRKDNVGFTTMISEHWNNLPEIKV